MAYTKLTPEVIETVCTAIIEGHTEKEAAQMAGISERSFYQYKSDNLQFSQSIKNAHQEYNARLLPEITRAAHNGLLQLLTGSEYDEKTVTIVKPNGQSETTTTKKVIPPNATAVIFALCNRMPDKYQNKVTGEIKQEIQTESKQTVDISKVSDATLKQLVEELSTELLTAPLPQ